MKRSGNQTLIFDNVHVASSAGVVGKKEGEGPIGQVFDYIGMDAHFGEDTWEKAETRMQQMAADFALKKCNKTKDDVDVVVAGDLLNQCVGSDYSVTPLGKAHLGIFGACSTMAESLIISAIMTDGDYANRTLAMTSSHFCTAERQFRYPLSYGSQRPPTAQWTVTGSGAFVVERMPNPSGICITKAVIGTPIELGITDTNNMGAAMAPSTAFTIRSFLEDTRTAPTDYDLILTGDLAEEGSRILIDILKNENNIDISGVHKDCGLMIFDKVKQDVHSGASGCGCSAVVLACEIMARFQRGELNNILFIGTGALMSTTSAQQGQPIVGIAHLVQIERR
ncbi:MAG: stage V sporulation protein AD [Bacillota bacterium]|nr:stage V sporulation protein AD [Bacillota bacterium]